MAKAPERPQKLVAENRRARHDYFIEDDIEAGIVLEGSEVKSLRTGKANISESYAAVEGGELWLINGYIPAYTQAKTFGHEERRRRKLLVNRRELAKLWQGTAREGMTLVPLRLYFNDRGKAKLHARHRQGQEARRQARDRGQARLAAAEGAADARTGLVRHGAADYQGAGSGWRIGYEDVSRGRVAARGGAGGGSGGLAVRDHPVCLSAGGYRQAQHRLRRGRVPHERQRGDHEPRLRVHGRLRGAAWKAEPDR